MDTTKNGLTIRYLSVAGIFFIVLLFFSLCAHAQENQNYSQSVIDRLTLWFDSVFEKNNPPIGVQFKEWQLSRSPPSPANNIMNEKKAALGKMLFFDPRLSGDGSMSCASCHDPNRGWADGLPTASGHKGKSLRRATPSIINVGYNEILMWDGRAKSLEDQALGPILNPDEMHNTRKNLVASLKNIPGYVKAFKGAYSGLGINEDRIRRSLAMFQRKIIVKNSPFDRWLQGDNEAMTVQQVRGFAVFTENGNCILCHRPPNFTDNGFHNIGLASYAAPSPDLGRHEQKPAKLTRGAFKTPSLRNVAQTAPYFHDGSATSLEAVVEHYAKGGEIENNLSPNMIKPNLTEQDKSDLVAFMKALTGKVDGRLVIVSLPK